VWSIALDRGKSHLKSLRGNQRGAQQLVCTSLPGLVTMVGDHKKFPHGNTQGAAVHLSVVAWPPSVVVVAGKHHQLISWKRKEPWWHLSSVVCDHLASPS
jgi:hypothetical protein